MVIRADTGSSRVMVFFEEWLWLLSWSLRSEYRYFIRALVAKRKRENATAEFTEREVGASRQMCQKAIMSMPNEKPVLPVNIAVAKWDDDCRWWVVSRNKGAQTTTSGEVR